jgi:hypothetical protein
LKSRIHILSQFIWPDGAPTAIYAEQLADALHRAGYPTTLVGGQGRYRRAFRRRPQALLVHLNHYCGVRSNLFTTAFEYCSIRRHFKQYIKTKVNCGDIVVVTTAPPNTINLAGAIRKKGAISIYWLQDYYPEVVRGLWDYPDTFRKRLCRYWDSQLMGWDQVIKAAGNLGYFGNNVRVIRNWPTVSLEGEHAPTPRTALYAGNFGYCQHVPTFINSCRDLHEKGYQITVRGDGPGIRRMPSWINVGAPFENLLDLIRAYWEAEIHLIAAHPSIRRAVFPSKIWNSIASGRQILAFGFQGEMDIELRASLESPYWTHLQQWIDFIVCLYQEKTIRTTINAQPVV